jgi:DNA topoisomerase-3
MFSKWKYLFYIHDSIYAIKKQIKNERRKQNLNEKNIKLVIAEKPSVAQSIAKVIGADKREDGYLEGNGYVVSWCVGHLVELASPESYDEKYEKWRYEDLPILPSEWNYQIAEATRKQFGILKKLMEREDVTGLVEATDAGREGELISRLVYDQAKCKKPFERLWISSMEDQAISDGFSNLKNGREYDDLYRAALCRERADWIVGMNATRLFSTLYGQTLNVGRVMTPTLAMIVQREAEIDGFKPESIYRLSISCGGITALSDRFEKKQDAENILNMLKEQKSAQVTKINPADKQEKAPQLYSLTALQRDANRFLGFTAQQTLDYTQSLYEKKLVTYPRTDSRFLTEDMESMIPDLAGKMAAKFGYTRKMVVHPKQVINNSKVSDHHAIIPNAIEAAEKLEGEKYISIKIGSYHKMIAASIENNCGEVKWKNGFPVSAKGKGGGIGLLNVQSSVKKYDGNLILKSDGNKFIAELFLNS